MVHNSRYASQLLARDTSERLGGGIGGADQIKAHPYFADMDWDLLSQQRLAPPYVPVLKSETDLTHFDDAFVAMSPRLSLDSTQEESLVDEGDPFARFSFDPVQQSPEVNKIARKKSLLRRQAQSKLSRDRFSSSSSLLSFQGEVVRHTDTLPAILHPKSYLSPKCAAHLRKRHSASLALDEVVRKDNDPHHGLKKRQPHPQDLIHHSTTSNTALIKRAPSGPTSLEDDSSLYSKSSMTFSSSALAAETRAGSEASDDPPRYHERPSCPVPGQSRPTIPLTSTACSSTFSSYENIQQHGF